MTEKPLSASLGIDQGAAEALTRAGVRTLQELAAADPESLAMASGIPLDRIREWHQRARRAAAPRRRNPVVTGWMVVIIGLLVAVLIGWIMMSLAARKMQEASQAEKRLQGEVEFWTIRAKEDLLAVQEQLSKGNWGVAAEQPLPRLRESVDSIKRVAPSSKGGLVEQVYRKLDELEDAVQRQSGDATDRLIELQSALDRLIEKK